MSGMACGCIPVGNKNSKHRKASGGKRRPHLADGEGPALEVLSNGAADENPIFIPEAAERPVAQAAFPREVANCVEELYALKRSCKARGHDSDSELLRQRINDELKRFGALSETSPEAFEEAIRSGPIAPTPSAPAAPDEPTGKHVRELLPSNASQREEWKNVGENILQEPLLHCYPESLEDVKQLVTFAVEKKLRLKAVGSGHSYSDVAATTDVLVETHKLDKVLYHDAANLVVEVESGITIKKLNEELWELGMALPNMGGYDGQTIVGAIATGTHGSGIGIGPLDSFVKSLVLVTSLDKGGHKLETSVLRVEKSEGWKMSEGGGAPPVPEAELLRDDDTFDSVVVSMGTMGVVYSLTLQLQPAFWLRETRELHPWSQVRESLRVGDDVGAYRHYEVLVCPHASAPGGDNLCIVTKRQVEKNGPRGPPVEEGQRQDWLSALVSSFKLSADVLRLTMNTHPELTPILLETALYATKTDKYVNRSYRIFNIGNEGLQISGCATELALPYGSSGDRPFLKAVDSILETAATAVAVGGVYHSSPLALRFVKQSSAHLAMQEGRDTCMIELPMLIGTYGFREIMWRLQDELIKEHQARPHWGLDFGGRFTGADVLPQMYPKLDKWLTQYERFNVSGAFSNSFTQRMGFDQKVEQLSSEAKV